MSSDQEPRRRRAAGTGPLVHAGAATAQTKSLRRYRKRQEQRVAHKASALRQYKKAMKKEGYEAGRGAGRKRYREDEEGGSDDGGRRRGAAASAHNDEEEASSDDEEGNTRNGNGGATHQKNTKRRKKIDPMADIRRKADKKREERSRMAEEREQKKKADASKERQRKKNYRTKQKRTRKGQPIMGDVIKGMLEKLQKDAGGN